VRTGGQEHLNAGGETHGVAWVRPDDVVESGAGFVRFAAVRVGAVIEQPPQRLRFEILARCEQNGEPAPAKSVDVGTMADQKLHHRNAAGLRHSHERHIVDQELAKCGVGGQERVDAREVVGSDRLAEFACLRERFDMLLQLGPAWEAVLSGDLQLCFGESAGSAGPNEVLGLVAKIAQVRTIRKRHGEILPCARCPHDSGERHFADGDGARLGLYPFRGPDASLTLVSE
jgi:hypothetical protein